MKLYEAKYHVRVGHARYHPGEVIEGGLSSEQTERLLRIGAIKEAGDIPDEIDSSWEDSGENEAGELSDHEDVHSSDESGTADGAADSEDFEAPEEEAPPLPPPEIDVMEGIGAAEEPEKPSRGGRRRK